MRILLLGELSGLHKELRLGLIDEGHEVITGHVGPAVATYPIDIQFYRALAQDRIGWSFEILSQLIQAPKLTGFDVLQFISPKVSHWKVQKALVRFIKRFNGAVVVVNTGCTTAYNQFVRQLSYSPCRDCKQYDLTSHQCVWERPEEIEFEHWMFGGSDAVVSTGYEYERAFSSTPYFAKNYSIPLPLCTSRHLLASTAKREKIRILYGETRHGFKGGTSIARGLSMIEASPYASQVEIIRTPRLPFEDYLAVLDTVDIVIDQSNSYGTGMNALYAMARGKVALTGAEPEHLHYLGASVADSPAINILPDGNDIFRKLVQLIKDPMAARTLGVRSREFVVRYHDARKVARMYVDMYREILAGKRARQGSWDNIGASAMVAGK